MLLLQFQLYKLCGSQLIFCRFIFALCLLLLFKLDICYCWIVPKNDEFSLCVCAILSTFIIVDVIFSLSCCCCCFPYYWSLYSIVSFPRLDSLCFIHGFLPLFCFVSMQINKIKRFYDLYVYCYRRRWIIFCLGWKKNYLLPSHIQFVCSCTYLVRYGSLYYSSACNSLFTARLTAKWIAIALHAIRLVQSLLRTYITMCSMAKSELIIAIIIMIE